MSSEPESTGPNYFAETEKKEINSCESFLILSFKTACLERFAENSALGRKLDHPFR